MLDEGPEDVIIIPTASNQKGYVAKVRLTKVATIFFIGELDRAHTIDSVLRGIDFSHFCARRIHEFRRDF